MIPYHFSLGPVQDFVAQARRTRDLWAGSFLLSFLTGKAMACVLDNGGTISFPHVDDDAIINAIRGKGGAPFIGSLPNRFMAELPEEHVAAPAKAVRTAWNKIAEAVWIKFVEPVHHSGCNTKEIWDRQIASFWELYWCAGKESSLDARKGWRTGNASLEAGEQCVIMSGWQELSGYYRSKDKTKQDAFWAALRSKLKGEHDLREDERLCAIALIKRLFPRASYEAVGWKVDVENWPSTAYMAALPFVLKTHQGDAAKEYVAKLKEENLGRIFGEYYNRIPQFQDARGERFCNLDGDLLFESPILCGKDRQELGNTESDKRKNIHKALKALYDAAKEIPRPHYALLLMDGDHMGKRLRKYQDRRTEISRTLQDFTQCVEEKLGLYNGVAVYAGGDDVLAMLPLDRAFEAASKLKETYSQKFREAGFPEADFTLSAALLFAHFNTPLLEVLHKAHTMLDKRAKEYTERNAVAVCVLKGDGEHAVWSGKWDYLEKLQRLCDSTFRDQAEDRNVSSSFLFRVIETLHHLSPNDSTTPGTPSPLLNGLDFKKIFVADYIKAREHWAEPDSPEQNSRQARLEAAQAYVDTMFAACTPYGPDTFLPDGLMIALFLTARSKSANKEG